MRDLAAVLLAAGGSSRFGRPKQLAPLDGVPLVRRAADVAIAAGCRRVIVVVGRDADACQDALRSAGDGVTVVRNPSWENGLGSSLRTGVAALIDGDDFDAAFLLLGDQPGVGVQTLTRLAAARRQTKRAVAVARYAATVGPPVLVGRSYLERLRDWPDERGAKGLWTEHPHDVVAVDCPEAAVDIDTPADYEAIVRSAGAAAPGGRS